MCTCKDVNGGFRGVLGRGMEVAKERMIRGECQDGEQERGEVSEWEGSVRGGGKREERVSGGGGGGREVGDLPG